MGVQQTQAAISMANAGDTISPHQVISLLLEGALERIEQAKVSLQNSDQDNFDLLVLKTIGILNGLRASLNFEQGGEIATNLDALYDYVAAQLQASPNQDKLLEASALLGQVKSGWDGIGPSA